MLCYLCVWVVLFLVLWMRSVSVNVLLIRYIFDWDKFEFCVMFFLR